MSRRTGLGMERCLSKALWASLGAVLGLLSVAPAWGAEATLVADAQVASGRLTALRRSAHDCAVRRGIADLYHTGLERAWRWRRPAEVIQPPCAVQPKLAQTTSPCLVH